MGLYINVFIPQVNKSLTLNCLLSFWGELIKEVEETDYILNLIHNKRRAEI